MFALFETDLIKHRLPQTGKIRLQHDLIKRQSLCVLKKLRQMTVNPTRAFTPLVIDQQRCLRGYSMTAQASNELLRNLCRELHFLDPHIRMHRVQRVVAELDVNMNLFRL